MVRGSRALALVSVVSLAVGAPACHPARGGSAQAGALAVSHAVVVAPTSPAEATAFLVIENRGSASVALVGAASPDADMVMLHTMAVGRMDPVTRLDIAPEGRLLCAPGRCHLMLMGLRRALAAGDTVSLELRFEGAASVTVRAPVLRYTEAVGELPER
jgi:periplasmic copper chaperone A